MTDTPDPEHPDLNSDGPNSSFEPKACIAPDPVALAREHLAEIALMMEGDAWGDTDYPAQVRDALVLIDGLADEVERLGEALKWWQGQADHCSAGLIATSAERDALSAQRDELQRLLAWIQHDLTYEIEVLGLTADVAAALGVPVDGEDR